MSGVGASDVAVLLAAAAVVVVVVLPGPAVLVALVVRRPRLLGALAAPVSVTLAGALGVATAGPGDLAGPSRSAPP